MKHSKAVMTLCLSAIADAELFVYFHAFRKEQPLAKLERKHSLSQNEGPIA